MNVIFEGGFLEEYKRCLERVREHLEDESIRLDNEVLDKLVNDELKKSDSEMDKCLIDLCLNALVSYKICTLKGENET